MDSEVVIKLTYKQIWDDGYGACGWKLDSTLNDPEIIASTPYHGERITTSVLIHDMLDHYLSGFGPSGHRNEAMALTQLGSRTGADIRRDFEQMIDEDILCGNVVGEPLQTFLPPILIGLLPSTLSTNTESMAFLVQKIGRESLRAILVERFYELGKPGIPIAIANFQAHGLNYAHRTATGNALQTLFEWLDQIVGELGLVESHVHFYIGNTLCRAIIDDARVMLKNNIALPQH